MIIGAVVSLVMVVAAQSTQLHVFDGTTVASAFSVYTNFPDGFVSSGWCAGWFRFGGLVFRLVCRLVSVQVVGFRIGFFGAVGFPVGFRI